MTTITATDLPLLIAGGAILVHVLPEEHFACERLPGAVNACVYEMTFLDKVRDHDFLGKHVVNDHIHLHVKLQATRSGSPAISG